MKRLIKKLVQGSVAAAAPTLWRIRGPSLLVIMYHRVLPADHPDRATEQPGMYVSPETLAMHLETLKRHFTLVHLDDWLGLAQSDQALPRNACAVTFDDGWRDNYQYAFPILRRAGAPATIYLVSDLVGTRYSFWPNTLARVLASQDAGVRQSLPAWLRDMLPGSGEALSPEEIDLVIARCKSRSDVEMLEVLAAFELPAEGDARDLMSWQEILEMQASGLIRFGSHTRRHSRVSKIEDAGVLRDEVLGSAQVLAERLGGPPVTFCYPNGDTSAPAVQLVRNSYRGAVTTARGWNGPATDRHLLNRVGVHEDVSNTPTTFLSRLAGVG
jgi:peptidoglycan/xylan/chitin deacetylase (PgdA/CDA1 family)